MTKSRLVYATLLQIEYLVCLLTAYLLGLGNWAFFTISLVLCLVLGFVTTAYYWILMDRVK